MTQYLQILAIFAVAASGVGVLFRYATSKETQKPEVDLVPLADVLSVKFWDLQKPIELTEQIKDDKFIATQTPTYMMGIPVEIDRDLPNSIVQFRWKGAVLFTIENLAIPCGFEDA